MFELCTYNVIIPILIELCFLIYYNIVSLILTVLQWTKKDIFGKKKIYGHRIKYLHI